jgi:diguanylate cyclase (GGDEF)-like protein
MGAVTAIMDDHRPPQPFAPTAPGVSDPGPPRARGRPWSLSTRVALVLGVSVVVPILGSAAYFANRNQADHQTTARAHIRSAANRLCTAADVYIDKHRSAITALAASLSGRPVRASTFLHDHLASAHRVYPGFLTMLVAGYDGSVVSASPLRAPDGSAVLAKLTRVNDRSYFVVPMQDRTTYVSEAFTGRGFGADPIVAISAPIEDATGLPIGIVEGSLDLRAFRALGPSAPGTTGIDHLIVDGRDRVIFSGGTTPLASLTPIGDTPLLRASRLEPGGAFLSYEVESTTGESPDARLAARCVTQAGWTIFATQSLTPIQAESARQYGLALAWTLVALVSALGIAIVMARSVTRPLDTLSAAVGAFHPHGAVPEIVRTGSEPAEVALLLDRFNAMAHRANESDRSMHQALDESRQAQAELAQVLATREFEVRQRTAELAARSEELAGANAKLEELANADPLTGIANRRALMAALDLASRTALRERVPVSVLAVDVDHFKAYNDALGHPAGDECLKRVARALDAVARRPLDRTGRTGGEEFVVVLYSVPAGMALRMGEKLRDAVESLGIPHPGAPSGRVTVSVGVATIHPDSDTVPGDALDLADAALYDAKRSGRNCVVAAAPSRTGLVGSQAG